MNTNSVQTISVQPAEARPIPASLGALRVSLQGLSEDIHLLGERTNYARRPPALNGAPKEKSAPQRVTSTLTSVLDATKEEVDLIRAEIAAILETIEL